MMSIIVIMLIIDNIIISVILISMNIHMVVTQIHSRTIATVTRALRCNLCGFAPRLSTFCKGGCSGNRV